MIVELMVLSQILLRQEIFSGVLNYWNLELLLLIGSIFIAKGYRCGYIGFSGDCWYGYC